MISLLDSFFFLQKSSLMGTTSDHL